MGPQRAILTIYGAWITLVGSVAVLTRVVGSTHLVLSVMVFLSLYMLAVPMAGAAGGALVPAWPVVERSLAGACCGFWVQAGSMVVIAALLHGSLSWQVVASFTDAHGWLVLPGVAAVAGLVVGAAMAWPPRSRRMADSPAA